MSKRRGRKDYGNFSDCALMCASSKGETWSTDNACATNVNADFAEDRALLNERDFSPTPWMWIYQWSLIWYLLG